MKNVWGRGVRKRLSSAWLKDTMAGVLRAANAFRLFHRDGTVMPVVIILATFFCGFAGSALAQPANDNFASASLITGMLGSTNSSNVNATLQAGETNVVIIGTNSVPVTNSVWFQWTATNNGYVTFNTIGSLDTNGNPMDTVLAAWTGSSVSSLTNVAVGDNVLDDAFDEFGDIYTVSNPNSSITFYAVSNTTYSISVDLNANDGVAGNYVLNWNAQDPANDNFTNAINLFSATSGTFVGTNINASLETNEPSVLTADDGQTVTVGNSIWYKWTAPQNGLVTFNTQGSLDELTNQQDTVLGIWTGNSVTNLTAVHINDNSGSVDNPSFNSSATFYATAGQTYDIAVYVNKSGPGLPGNDVVLNWFLDSNTSPYGGTFQLTSPKYQFSQDEANAPLNSDAMLANDARATVTRIGNADGMADVTYTITNTWYNNFSSMAIIQTNQTFGTTNIITTVTNTISVYENYNTSQGFYYIGTSNATVVTLTLTNSVPVSTNIVLNAPYVNFPVSGLVTNFSATNISGIFTTNYYSYTTNISGTAISYTNTMAVNTLNSLLGLYGNFGGSGELTFRDFQMNADIFLGAASTLKTVNYANPLAVLILNNANLDPDEDPSLPSPGISPSRNMAYVSFYSPYAIPGVFGTNSLGSNTFNFERSTLRCEKTVNGSGTATVWVTCPTHLDNNTATVYYRIDHNLNDDDYNSFPLQAGSDYARPDNAVTRYAATNDFTSSSEAPGTLTWGPGDNFPKSISIPITQDSTVKFNQDIQVELYQDASHVPADGAIGAISTCTVTILLTTEAAGAVDTSYMPEANSASDPVYTSVMGANGPVNAVVVQPFDGKAIIAGGFTSYSATSGGSKNYIARLNTTGKLDSTFNIGSGFGGGFSNGGNPETPEVNALALDSNDNIVVVGDFTSFNGPQAKGIERLLTTGAADPAFSNFGLGANNNIRALAIQPNGQILIGGDFTSYNGTNCNYIARLNTDGSLDTSFNPGQGPSGSVYSVAVQPNGNILIGGAFTSVDGASFNNIARLNTNGTLDTTFSNLDIGPNGAVNAIVVQTNNLILVGGQFTSVDGDTNLNFLARLNSDGSLDTTFESGSGPNDTVNCISLQPDGTFYIGGYFTSVNQTRRVGIARMLPSGWVDTTFMDTAYNQFAGVPNAYYSGDPFFFNGANQPNPIYSIALQPDGNVIIGGSFSAVGGAGGSPGGVNYNGLNDGTETRYGGWTTEFNREEPPHPRRNVARLIGGATPGPGNIVFDSTSYSANNGSGAFFVPMDRVNGTLGAASATFEPVQLGTGPGYAASGVDYFSGSSSPTWGVTWNVSPSPTWMLEDGVMGPNDAEQAINNYTWYNANSTYIDIISNNYNGGVTVDLVLTAPLGLDTFFLGGSSSAGLGGFGNPATAQGENIPLGVALGNASSPLLIDHRNPNPGILSLTASYYYTNENAGYATIAVVRTQGTSGQVSLNYTTGGGTAVPGRDYTTTRGTLFFPDGGNPSVENIVVPIINYYTNQPDRTFGITIYSPGNGATLGTITNALVEIINGNIASGFAEFVGGTPATNAMNYGIAENDNFAQVSIARLGGTLGVLQVNFATTNGTAQSGTNYVGVSTNLVWQSGVGGVQTVNIPILDSGNQSSNLTVKLNLSHATLGGISFTNQGAYTNGLLTITNTDLPGTAEFTSSSFSINENAGYAIIPIVRTGGSAGSLSVQFYTLDGTATNGINYMGVSNSVLFAPGQVSTNIIVGITNQGSSSALNFSVVLANPSPTNGLGSPSMALVTINGSQSVSQPPGQPDNFGGSLNGSVLAMALQANGQIVAGGAFTLADGLPRQYIARFNTDGSLDTTFSSYLPTWGANAPVESLAIEASGLVLVGGEFTNFNNQIVNYITRLNADGSTDLGFNAGTGANNPVFAMAQTFVSGTSRIVVGGAFTTFNGYPANSIVQLLDTGAIDPSFSASANATVYAVAVQPNGQVLIGGDFTNVNGVAVNHIARLNANGSIDYSFTNALTSPAAGANGSVHAIALQLDGRILIGGYFTNVDGVPCNYVARLNQNGSLDTGFANAQNNTATGANAPVNTITVQPDTRIVVGGAFTEFNGVTRNRVTRLNVDGTTDPTINFGTGADGFVAASLLQTNGEIVLGGGFLNFNSIPHAYIVRLYGGSAAGSGTFAFSMNNYQVVQNGVVAPITIIRSGGTSGTNSDGSGNVYVTFLTTTNNIIGINYSAVPNVNFTPVSTTVAFPAGEVEETVDVPVLNDSAPLPPSWTVGLDLTNPQPASAVSISGENPAQLTIFNTSTEISFASGTYSVANNVANGEATINLILQGYTNATSSVVFSTTGGTAVPGIEYMPVPPTTLTFNPGVTNVSIQVPIILNTNYTGNQTVTMALSSPVNASLYAPSNATLTIVDTANAAGQLLFQSSNYVYNESSGQAVVTVLYTNGDLPVSVQYTTVQGSALPGINYQSTSGTLNFSGSLTSQPITVQLPQNATPQGPVNFSIVLSNPTGGGTLIQPSNAVVTILDDINTGVAFDTGTNTFEETNGVVSVLVDRLGQKYKWRVLRWIT